MTDTFSYRGYTGTVEADAESEMLFGKVLFIRSLIVYEADTVPELRKNFESVIDDYLASCEADGSKPEKPASGTFNVRIGASLHQAAATAALRNNLSLNEWIKQAVELQLQTEASQSPRRRHSEDTSKNDFTTQFRKLGDDTSEELLEG